MFAGESMFYKEASASKAAFCYLVEFLKEKGCQWIDCQVTTPLLESFGAKEISRLEFMDLLKESLTQKNLFS